MDEPVQTSTPVPQTPPPTVSHISSSRPLPKRTDEVLEEILAILHTMNRRDRMRTLGSFFKTLIILLPTIIFLGGTWYVYAHGAELFKAMTEQMVQILSKPEQGFIKSLEGILKPKK